MSNVNDFRKGSRIVVREGVRGNYLDAQFPGWGQPDAYDHLLPIASIAGMTGVVSSVNSHGSNPWTRYSIRLANGGLIIDGVPGVDFDWA